jgi:DNA polymerase
VIVCMGGTAAQSVFARPVKVLTERGKLLTRSETLRAVITVHPSSILRAPDEAQRKAQYEDFVADLGVVRHALRRDVRASGGERVH